MWIVLLVTMQKEIVQGIPFWKDKNNNLFSYKVDKKNLIQLGTFDPNTQTYTLSANWKELYSSELSEYRANLKNRDRKENKLTVTK